MDNPLSRIATRTPQRSALYRSLPFKNVGPLSPVSWQQARDVVAARSGEGAIEAHETTTVPTREAEHVRSVICLPVVAPRTSGMAAGDAASGQNECSRPAAVSMRI